MTTPESESPQGRTPEALAIAREIIARESQAPVRYVIEVSKPRVVGGRDPDALSRLQDLYRESELGLSTLRDMVSEIASVPRGVRWSLETTGYNFLRPTYLLRPVVEHTEQGIGVIEALGTKLAEAGWSEAAQVVEGMVDGEREQLALVRQFADEIGEIPVDSPQVKGTSASRW
jgi:hypothetical protein